MEITLTTSTTTKMTTMPTIETETLTTEESSTFEKDLDTTEQVRMSQ